MKDTAHPFILWTRDEAEAIRKRIASEAWAKAEYDRMLAGMRGGGETFVDLFKYQVMKDEKAGQAQLEYLLSFIGAKVDERRWSDHYLTALRFDVLFDRLTPAQYQGLADTFRKHIQYQLDNPFPNTRTSWLPNMQWPRMISAHLMAVALQDEDLIRRLWGGVNGFKWYLDEYVADGGLYFEEFGKIHSLVGEMLLYCRGLERLGLDELGFGYTGIGKATMRSYVEGLLWLGYPRVDIPGGLPHYPRVSMGDAKGGYDAMRAPALQGMFQQSIVIGHLPDGTGGWNDFFAANMNGRDHRDAKVEKLQLPQWFEIIVARYPDSPCRYFLAQMRRPGQDKYYPTLFWGLGPIGPKEERSTRRMIVYQILEEMKKQGLTKAELAKRMIASSSELDKLLDLENQAITPESLNKVIKAVGNASAFRLAGLPPLAPSRVFNERGFALLRADETESYWEGPGPAVALQFATLYVHYVSDCFSLLGYYAYNRPIYVNRTISFGYAGGPYDFHVRGHCGVVVDNLQAQPIGPVPERHDFSPLVKFVAARGFPLRPQTSVEGEVRSSDQPKEPATRLYPGVDLARGLLLTREYLFDAYQLQSDRPRSYHWLVHALGEARPDELRMWGPSDELQKTLFNTPEIKIAGERRMGPTDEGWSLSTLQTCALPEVSKSLLGKDWYGRQVGVRVSMLGEPGTTVFTYDFPGSYAPGSPRTAPPLTLPSPQGGEGGVRGADRTPSEVGGVSVVAARKGLATMFVALHEPFERGKHRIRAFWRIQQTDRDIAAGVVGEEAGVNDRLMMRLGEDCDQPVTLARGEESFTFADHAFVRITKERVDASGHLTGMTLRVTGRPTLLLNGQEQRVSLRDGLLHFGF